MEFLNEDDECSEAEAKLLAKLEKYFQSEGLSKFSSRAGVAYFQVGAIFRWECVLHVHFAIFL